MRRKGGLSEAHLLLIIHIISLKWQGAIAFLRHNCVFRLQAEMRPSGLHYCELPTWEMRMQWLEILPGSTLVTQRDKQMLNKQEINSFFSFSFPHKRPVCFCWTFAGIQAAIRSQCVLSHLTFGVAESSPWWGQKACPGCSVCWAGSQLGWCMGGVWGWDISSTLKCWKTTLYGWNKCYTLI